MNDLRGRIEVGIQDGSVPDIDCLISWFGHGRGELCVACTSRILGSEVSVECDLPGGNTVWFHARCYDVWLTVRGVSGDRA